MKRTTIWRPRLSPLSTQVPDDFKRCHKKPVILVVHFEITKIDSFIKKAAHHYINYVFYLVVTKHPKVSVQ